MSYPFYNSATYFGHSSAIKKRIPRLVCNVKSMTKEVFQSKSEREERLRLVVCCRFFRFRPG